MALATGASSGASFTRRAVKPASNRASRGRGDGDERCLEPRTILHAARHETGWGSAPATPTSPSDPAPPSSRWQTRKTTQPVGVRSRCRNGDVPDPGLSRGAAIVPNGVGDGDGPALHAGLRRQVPIGINVTMEDRVTIIRDRQLLQVQRLLWPLAQVLRSPKARRGWLDGVCGFCALEP